MDFPRSDEVAGLIELCVKDAYERGFEDGKRTSAEDSWAEGYREGYDEAWALGAGGQ